MAKIYTHIYNIRHNDPNESMRSYRVSFASEKECSDGSVNWVYAGKKWFGVERYLKEIAYKDCNIIEFGYIEL